MNLKSGIIIRYSILFLIAVMLILFAFKGVHFGSIVKKILQANPFWIIISVFISIIAFIVRAYRWNLLIEPMGYSPSLKKTTYALMVGYFANLAFPRLGEVSRCGALSKAESIPFNKLLGTVIIERVIDVISLLICVILTTVIEFNRLGSFLNENIFLPILEKWHALVRSPLAISITVFIMLALTGALFYFFRKNSGKESWLAKIIRGLLEGLQSVAKLQRPWLFLFHSVLIWVLYYLGVYVCLFALPSTSQLGPAAALFLLVAGGLGMSAPVQGGIGAYHLLVSQGLILYGLTQQDGLTFATLLHSLQTILVILLGIVSLVLLFTASREGKKNKTGN